MAVSGMRVSKFVCDAQEHELVHYIVQSTSSVLEAGQKQLLALSDGMPL